MAQKQQGSLILATATAAAAAATVTAVSLYLIASPIPQEPLTLAQKLKTFIIGKTKSIIIQLSGVENRLIILRHNNPPSTNSEQPQGIIFENGGNHHQQHHHHHHHHQKMTLLQIFPGANIDGSEYIEIGKAVQKLAESENTRVVVAIGISLKGCSRLVEWALSNSPNYSMTSLMRAKAERVIVQEESLSPHERISQVFENNFVWGHSWGGFEAMIAALPSTNNGLILYGCSLSLYRSPQGHARPDLIQNNLLSSYPRPVLTIMGERDGFLRWYTLAGEAHTLHKDSQRRIGCSQSPASVKEKLQMADELRKPVVILSELNHMHMAMGRVPEATAKTGRGDLKGPTASLEEAHEKLARVVVDFMHAHSESTEQQLFTNKIKQQAEKRLLKQHTMTESLFLGPFSRLSDRLSLSQFLGEIQRKLLHVTSHMEEHFNFYDDSDHNNDDDDTTAASMGQGIVEKEPLTIVTNWHQEANDFLYSKPRWALDDNHLWLEAAEQGPISVSRVSQISNTIAFKGKTQDYVLYGNTKFQAIKDGPAPTLMQLNTITFHQVLHNVVTPQQRQRYKKYGKELRFGPDILVLPPPKWVETPISLTRYPPPDRLQEHEESYYLLQSPYVTTAHIDYIPPPFAGAWYGKPLSPAQAYEWIVFDAFKP